jgi:hypothetical protein
VQQKLKKLDTVMLNKVIVEDNIECVDKHQLDFDNTLSTVIFLLASVKDEVAFSGTSIRLFYRY